jgi:hypothetical protein
MVTVSLAPGRSSPSSLLMNGFHAGNEAVSVRIAQTSAGLASISIVWLIWRFMMSCSLIWLTMLATVG